MYQYEEWFAPPKGAPGTSYLTYRDSSSVVEISSESISTVQDGKSVKVPTLTGKFKKRSGGLIGKTPAR